MKPARDAPFLHFDSRRWPKGRSRRRLTKLPASLASGHMVLAKDLFLRHDQHRTSTGTRILHLSHHHQGLRVFRSTLVVKTGREAPRCTPRLFRVPARLSTRPATRASEATAAALTFLQRRKMMPPLAVELLRETCLGQLVDAPAVVELRRGLVSPARLHLEIFPEPDDRAELAWVGDLDLENGRRFHVVVSAARSRPTVLFAAQTNSCSFSAQWVPTPGVSETATCPMPTFATPDGGLGSPSVWQTGSGASGPNVSCHHGDAQTIEPLGSLAVDNAFVWCNLLHDFFLHFGFDSEHHAFEGDDPLRVEELKQKSSRGGEFENHCDGWQPRMVLYASPDGTARHAAMDPTILVHEYTHGVSNRLVGGAACQYPFLEPQALGFSEGMSDYFALTVVNFVDRSRGGSGALLRFGGIFNPAGIRDYETFDGGWTHAQTDPYRIGMAWCAALLDSRAAIKALGHGDDVTDRFIWQACLNTFKSMAPLCKYSLSLTLAHAKDALVSEAKALEGPKSIPGAKSEIATAFGKRGI